MYPTAGLDAVAKRRTIGVRFPAVEVFIKCENTVSQNMLILCQHVIKLWSRIMNIIFKDSYF
jgi:hypothetical protein